MMGDREKRNVVIYGIGDNFIRYHRLIFDIFNVIALVDANKDKYGMSINGFCVNDLSYFNNNICDEVLITPNNFNDIKSYLTEDIGVECKIISLKDFVDIEYFSKNIKVLFESVGSDIDCLMNINYATNWSKYYASRDINVFFVGESIVDIFTNNNCRFDISPVTYITDKRNQDYNEFDMVIRLYKYPDVLLFNQQKIAQRFEKLVDYYQYCEKFKMMNPRLFREQEDMSGAAVIVEKINGRKRIQQPDIYEILKINENCSKNKFIYKKQIVLFYDELAFASISLEVYLQLLKLLSVKYPKYDVLFITKTNNKYMIYANGLNREADIDEIVEVINLSSLYIGMESVWVHYRKMMGNSFSVAIFGPTSVEFYGYKSNINIETNACVNCCEGLSDYSNMQCVNERYPFICVREVSVKLIFEAVKNSELKWKIYDE